MSFASTPLGQGRRLDHRTFLNKKPVSTSSLSTATHIQPTARTHRQQTHPPASYAYGAPTTSSRSPPKPDKPPAVVTTSEEHDNSDSEQPALVRFARLKEREQTQQQQQQQPQQQELPQQQQQQTRLVGPRVISTPPNPDKWSFKDTSVNIASAFHRAAGTTITIPAYDSSASSSSAQNTLNTSASIMNPNDSWASGTQHRPAVPRSTSVEYEKETHSLVSRRLAAPPPRNNGAARPKPLSRTESVYNLPDFEGEGESSHSITTSRPKTFGEHVMDATRRLAPATFFMRRQSVEPEGPANDSQSTSQEKSGSYEYSAEEREFLLGQQDDSASRPAAAAHRRNRISVDNKAYKPSLSDLEESESDYSSDDGKRSKGRKGKKNGAAGGPLKTLPVAGYDKRRRRRVGGRDDGEEDDSEGSEEEQTEGKSTEQLAVPRSPRAQRVFAHPATRLSGSQPSVPLPSWFDSDKLNATMDMESGLQSIREVEEALEPDGSIIEQVSLQVSESSFSIGAVLGRGVHLAFKTFGVFMNSLWAVITYIPLLVWRVLGHVYARLILEPIHRVASTDLTPLYRLGKYAIVGLGVYLVWYALSSGILEHLPSRSAAPYTPPTSPPTDITDWSTRLLELESMVARIALNTERSQTQHEAVVHKNAELAGLVSALESRVTRETSRIYDAEDKVNLSTEQKLQSIRQALKLLNEQIEAQQRQWSEREHVPHATSDEEARTLLHKLEERMGHVETEIKDTLERSSHAVDAARAMSTAAAWWDKLATSKDASVTIKSTDGQDVTSLITHIVDKSISRLTKDTLARADYAMYSNGAAVIPSLTSETLEIRPQGFANQLLGSITGNGYAVGRPPVTALHHDINGGHCWPFPGQRGQLGIKLAEPIYITDVTIDHAPRELARDIRSAPRQVELWGYVEGEDNREKIAAWRAQRKFFDEAGVEYTSTLNPENWVQLTTFAYNIHAPNHVQTFSIPEEIQKLGVDFGVVVLATKSNWGLEEFTCLYRVRVHGEPLANIPDPLPESDLNRYVLLEASR